ncbi:MAG: hypothetical protein SGPRY_014117 [Prymnesium sp.]
MHVAHLVALASGTSSPRSLPPRVVLPPIVRRVSSPSLSLHAQEPLIASCASDFAKASHSLVMAARALSESPQLEQAASRLTEGGGALSAASISFAEVSHLLSEESQDWEAATSPLSEAAGQLRTAGSSLSPIDGGALGRSALELETASCTTGCISLAAAAGPDLQAAGDDIEVAGAAVMAYGETLLTSTASTAAHGAAAKQFNAAGSALKSAGSLLREAGSLLENGKLYSNM